VNIRLCRLEDESKWIDMNREFMNLEIHEEGLLNNTNNISHVTFQNTFREAMKHPQLITLLLIELDEELIGFANLLTIYSVWAHGKAIVIDDLFLRPEYRRRGFGRKIIHYIENLAKEQKYKRVQFLSEFSNPDACAFYVNLGYVPTNMHFYVKYV
jgi:GNAT superfamily N-acetyltransferase